MLALNLKQLEAFCAVVEQGSFTAAAEVLYLAQSTISGHVSALEKDLRVPLLIRSGRHRVILTEEGRRVYTHARAILQSCSELSREVEEQNTRELTIAASSIPKQYILPGIITDFAAAAPEIRFTLHGGDSTGVHELVLHGEAQIGFVGSVLDNTAFRYDAIAEDPLVLVTPNTAEFRELKAAGTPGNELLSRPLIFREGGSGTQVAGQRFMTENGIQTSDLNIIARVDDSEALLRCVACGLGCAVISGLAAASDKSLLSFPLVGKNPSRRLYMIRPLGRRMTAAAQQFAEFILSRIPGDAF